MHRVKEEVKTLKEKFETPLNCLETGTIRSYHEKHESTRHISETLGDDGHLKSLDIESKHIEVSKNICGDVKNVSWIECDSLNYLKEDEDEYHFVLLDSVNDPWHIMNEFKLIANRVHEGGSIMVDDAGTDAYGNYQPTGERFQAKKGWAVCDWCKSNDVDWQIVVGGHSYQVLIPVTKKNKDRFQQFNK